MIGDILTPEWHEYRDVDTGRKATQLTSASGHSYPLYYFGPSITADSRYLVFHSERSGWVQLYRLDLTTGEIGQLTDGRTLDSGWAIWCEWRLRGVYNHLSALNPREGEVFYFQDEELRASKVDTFENRVVARLPSGHMPVGQSAFSPDGSLFAFIHVEADDYVARLREREYLINSGLYAPTPDHERFREGIRTILSVLNTRTNEYRTAIETDFHFHHVGFFNHETMIINHPRGCHGMWTVGVEGGETQHLRPGDADGAHGAEVVHQHVTSRGIAYEAVYPASAVDSSPEDERTTYLGLYDPATSQFAQLELPVQGYIHVGLDPAAEFWFVERTGSQQHELLSVEGPPDPSSADHGKRRGDAKVAKLELLRKLGMPAHQQRRHAHPFLSPDRTELFFTDRGSDRFSQVHRLDVADHVRSR
jgi:hypothetical protein